MEGTDYTVSKNSIPCCPHNPTLSMKREGSKSHLRSNSIAPDSQITVTYKVTTAAGVTTPLGVNSTPTLQKYR